MIDDRLSSKSNRFFTWHNEKEYTHIEKEEKEEEEERFMNENAEWSQNGITDENAGIEIRHVWRKSSEGDREREQGWYEKILERCRSWIAIHHFGEIFHPTVLRFVDRVES